MWPKKGSGGWDTPVPIAPGQRGSPSTSPGQREVENLTEALTSMGPPSARDSWLAWPRPWSPEATVRCLSSQASLPVANGECSHHAEGSACGLRAGQAVLGMASKDLVRQLYSEAPTGLLRLSPVSGTPKSPPPGLSIFGPQNACIRIGNQSGSD